MNRRRFLQSLLVGAGIVAVGRPKLTRIPKWRGEPIELTPGEYWRLTGMMIAREHIDLLDKDDNRVFHFQVKRKGHYTLLSKHLHSRSVFSWRAMPFGEIIVPKGESLVLEVTPRASGLAFVTTGYYNPDGEEATFLNGKRMFTSREMVA